MMPAGRCAHCRRKVPGLFVQCSRCQGPVIASVEARDGELPALLLKVLEVARS